MRPANSTTTPSSRGPFPELVSEFQQSQTGSGPTTAGESLILRHHLEKDVPPNRRCISPHQCAPQLRFCPLCLFQRYLNSTVFPPGNAILGRRRSSALCEKQCIAQLQHDTGQAFLL